MPNLLSLLRGERCCRDLMTFLVGLDHDSLLVMELETHDRLHYSPVNVIQGVFGPPFPVVHDHLLCLAHVEGWCWSCA